MKEMASIIMKAKYDQEKLWHRNVSNNEIIGVMSSIISNNGNNVAISMA
jgi:hypothetical protein